MIYIKAGKLGDDHVHAATSSEWQVALRFDLRFAMLIAMGLHDHDLGGFGVGYEVHSATHALDHFTRDDWE